MLNQCLGALLLSGLAALAGCDDGGSSSGDGGSGGDTTSTTTSSTASGTPTSSSSSGAGGGGMMMLSMIDDMEDQDGSILATEGRKGAWYTYNDETATATQTPAAGDPFTMSPVPKPRTGSAYAAHTSGKDFMTWGAGFGFDFNVAAMVKSSYDASKYKGIVFYAVAGSAAAIKTVRVDLSDKNTAPEGGVCDNAAGKCNDNFGTTITLSTDWQQYTLPFDTLEQQGFGQAFPALDAATLYAVHFQAAAKTSFDIWIDDIAFYQ